MSAPLPPIPNGAAFLPPPPPPPPVPAKKGINTCLLVGLILGGVGFFGIFIIAILAGVALGPITKGIERAKENMAMQQARTIELAMQQYSLDNRGIYPDGETSTEVFQKLLDGKYLTDPSMFYLAMPGKTKALEGATTLTAENVCFDVTVEVGHGASPKVPVVFSTGYELTYHAGEDATLISSSSSPFKGLAVAYRDSSAKFIRAQSDGQVVAAVPKDFAPDENNYRQLKP